MPRIWALVCIIWIWHLKWKIEISSWSESGTQHERLACQSACLVSIRPQGKNTLMMTIKTILIKIWYDGLNDFENKRSIQKSFELQKMISLFTLGTPTDLFVVRHTIISVFHQFSTRYQALDSLNPWKKRSMNMDTKNAQAKAIGRTEKKYRNEIETN